MITLPLCECTPRGEQVRLHKEHVVIVAAAAGSRASLMIMIMLCRHCGKPKPPSRYLGLVGDSAEGVLVLLGHPHRVLLRTTRVYLTCTGVLYIVIASLRVPCVLPGPAKSRFVRIPPNIFPLRTGCFFLRSAHTDISLKTVPYQPRIVLRFLSGG